MSILLLVFGLIMFIGLVVVHELGHFFAARRNGVEVEEFGIGFPPRAWNRRLKSGLLFSLNWLPIGGFVRLKGENDSDKSPGSFGSANLLAKIKIMVAGVGMNLLTAFVLLTILAFVGMPRLVDNQFTVESDTKVVANKVFVGLVEDNSPAKAAGLQQRDQIISFSSEQNNYPINNAENLADTTKLLAGQSVTVNFVRGGEAMSAQTIMRTTGEVEASLNTDNPKGHLGIAQTEYTLTKSSWSSPIVAAGLIKQFTELTLKGIGTALGNLITGNGAKASEQVAGPVGIFAIFNLGSYLGYQFILMIVAVISLTLAIMNILPIPALDGGRLFVTLIYRALRKPLTKKAEDRIHGTGFAMLMMLFVLITIVDIKRFF